MNRRQKKKQIKMRNKKLVKEYPFLLPRNVFTDDVPDDYNYEYTRYEEIPEGWRKAFGKELLKELKESLVRHNCLNKFRFSQIKEKYGRLCLYNFGAPDETHRIIQKYEVISEYVCIRCGRPDVGVIDNYGWYEPVCKKCYDNQKLSRNWRTVPYEDLLDTDENNIPSSYKVHTYRAGKDEIVEYDISETVDKIRRKWKHV